MYLRNSNPMLRRWVALAFSMLIAAAISWCGTGSVSDLSLGKGRDSGARAQEPHRNPEAQKLKNPEPNNAETLEAGKKLYARHCASCHGPNGKGDGGMALAGGTPSDLTDEAWDYGSTDGEIFVSIRDGVSADMLAYKEKLSEKQIWQVVSFIRSLGPKPSK